ncbi:MAG: DNA topoisomerase I [delta proteobacterium MLS_D]|jgi:DNA topoisomerase I|nr:MAG: DNA topoisomerase I [delta proteobacterium MLS_D]
MPSTLIIVESPTKVKTIKKYLGAGFDVRASVGHVKDLPKNKLGIDIEQDFTPSYIVKSDRKKTISELKKAAVSAERILLAPDPDREGEAIAWHIAEEIGGKNKKIFRILFGDLTKKTVLDAIEKPLSLDVNKYEAQQTRRILDRLVGYRISPVLWEKVRRGLSAGRVQSVAVRIICEREREIGDFRPEEYWTITARLEGGEPPPFEAKLFKIDGRKKTVATEEEAQEIVRTLEQSSFLVDAVEKKEVKRQPAPPFTTSKLQQEAAQRFRFSAKKTMMTAQRLYEGIELGDEGPVGLITYMRTDSVRIADEALDEARRHIRQKYGDAFLPSKARRFKTAKSAQDAHEAIRPASIAYPPEAIEQYLEKDEFRLYRLIWNRFIASQMAPAFFDRTTIDIAADRFILRARGSVMTSPGFTLVYTDRPVETSADDHGAGGDDDASSAPLPPLSAGDVLSLSGIDPRQNFTQPPPRFSEATLVKELEERGIGRPSTYAAILSTIQERDYVVLENRRFQPTELGFIVTDLLVHNFPAILDVGFTAAMEDKLDRIEEGKLTRIETLREFYESFTAELENARVSMRNIKKEEEPTDLVCEKCGSPMVVKWGRNGKFLACSNYPACKNTANISRDEDGKVDRKEPEVTDILCEQCGKPLVIKEGKFGRFLGCSGYPECTFTKPIETGVPCPREGCDGILCERRTRRGRTFYGCSRYPECTFATWDRPVPEKCPLCGSPYLLEKHSRTKGTYLICPNKECGYRTDEDRST